MRRPWTDGNGIRDIAERNVIAAMVDGIRLIRSSNNVIAGNFIGTDRTGTRALGNWSGVATGPEHSDRIGTNGDGLADEAERNVISGNSNGVVLGYSTTGPVHDMVVWGNHIGTDVTGLLSLGNHRGGVFIPFVTYDNQIGGDTPAKGNIIAFNGWDWPAARNRGPGVGVMALNGIPVRNRIQGNSIHSNAGLGIDLGLVYPSPGPFLVRPDDPIAPASGFGVDRNDPGDSDSGTNGLQNYPILTAANGSGGSTTITGTLDSTPNTAFVIDFFASPSADPSGYGQGQTFLGAASVSTDETGRADFIVTLPVDVPAHFMVTATATDPSGNTSEFSFAVVENTAPLAGDDSYDAIEDTPLEVAASGVLGNDSDQDGDGLSVQLLANSAHGTLTLQADGSFRYVPDPDYNGPDSFRYRVFDGRVHSSEAEVRISIAAVNDAPVNAVPGSQEINQNATLVFSTLNGNPISIADVDAGGDDMEATLAATNGVMTLQGMTGLTFTTGDGTADAAMTFCGTLAAINAALEGLLFAPPNGFNGTASIMLTTNDLGHTGAGGSMTDGDTVIITVRPATNPVTADLSVTMSASPDPATVGSPLTYTIVVTNNGPSTASSVLLTDNLPPGVTFVSATSTRGSCTEASGTVTCSLGYLSSGRTATVTVVITPTRRGAITNRATVVGNETDPDLLNNRAVTQTQVGGPQGLRAASLPTSGLSQPLLTPRLLQLLLAETIARWQAAGVTAAQVDALRSMPVRIADLGGGYLGLQHPSTIWIDDDAAGWGWFVDPTPGDDAEFTTPGDQGEQGRMDLLSVLMHEIGHVLGREHEEDGVMQETLAAGQRRLLRATLDGDGHTSAGRPGVTLPGRAGLVALDLVFSGLTEEDLDPLHARRRRR